MGRFDISNYGFGHSLEVNIRYCARTPVHIPYMGRCYTCHGILRARKNSVQNSHDPLGYGSHPAFKMFCDASWTAPVFRNHPDAAHGYFWHGRGYERQVSVSCTLMAGCAL